MAKKQQISFSLAFLAAAIILLAGEATARRELEAAKADGAEGPTLEMILNEMISATQRAKAKVPVLGNSQMVKECDKAYSLSLENLNKALGLNKAIKDTKDVEELEATVMAALHAYDNCDYVFAQSTRPSPFIPNNANLKSLGSKCLQFTSKEAKKN